MPGLLSTTKEVGQTSAAESGSPSQRRNIQRRKTSTVVAVLLLRCQAVYPILASPLSSHQTTGLDRAPQM